MSARAIAGAALVLGLLLAPASAGAAVQIGHLPPAGATVAGPCGGDGTYVQHSQAPAPAPRYTVPAGGGVLTSWVTRAGTTMGVTAKLKVLSFTSGFNYTTVAQHGFFPLTPSTDNLFTVGPPGIPVQAGQVISLRFGSTAAACVWTTGWTADAVHVTGGDAPPGDFNTYNPAALGGRRLNLEATIEPDADGDGFGDETQDGDDDNDGVGDAADNCPGTGSGSAADLDGDGQGDACDGDDDGDGLPDSAETAFGTDPRAADSDGDGRIDGTDACPSLPGSTANGCPGAVDSAPPRLALIGFARRATRRALLRRGVRGRVVVSEPADLTLRVLGRLRGARVARAGDVVLVERRLRMATGGTRRVTLKIPRRLRRSLARRLRLTLDVEATDPAGNRSRATRRVTVR